MTRTLIAACGGSIVSRLRKTFPVVPIEALSPALRRRGRILSRDTLAIAELPALADAEVTAELAFYLGGLPSCTAVLMVIPAPDLILADRIAAPGRRELIPDLLEPVSRLDEAVRIAEIVDPVAWGAARWAFRRLGPHQFWVVGLPVTQHRGKTGRDVSTAGAGAPHRGLRSVVAALEEQNR